MNEHITEQQEALIAHYERLLRQIETDHQAWTTRDRFWNRMFRLTTVVCTALTFLPIMAIFWKLLWRLL